MARVFGHKIAIRRAGCLYRPSQSESDSASQLRDPRSGGSSGNVARTASKNEARSTIPFAGNANVVAPLAAELLPHPTLSALKPRS